MTHVPNIILVGPMGAGKTTIGRLLAQSLGRDFLDSDRVIEENAGADIPWIFEKEGEQGFRRRETSTLQQLTQEYGAKVVLATGGGAIMRKDNRTILQQGGLVIYLYATISQQVQRTSRTNHRPLLKTGNRQQILTDLFKERDPLYRETADVIVKTDSRNPKLVANKVLGAIEQHMKKEKQSECAR
ncbi:shikimate kinase AroK [Marinomonas agarivorans]|nr:shikimate kinase AroK [Marinomonas agarivorans]